MRFNDALSGSVLLALAIFVWVTAAGFPKLAGAPYGAAFFPQVLAVLLGLAALMLIFRGLKAWRNGEAVIQAGAWARNPARWLGLGLIIGALLLYAGISSSLGFHVTVFLIAIVLMLYLGVRLWLAALVAAIAAIVLWLFFARVLLVPLPGGILTSILW